MSLSIIKRNYAFKVISFVVGGNILFKDSGNAVHRWPHCHKHSKGYLKQVNIHGEERNAV